MECSFAHSVRLTMFTIKMPIEMMLPKTKTKTEKEKEKIEFESVSRQTCANCHSHLNYWKTGADRMKMVDESHSPCGCHGGIVENVIRSPAFNIFQTSMILLCCEMYPVHCGHVSPYISYQCAVRIFPLNLSNQCKEYNSEVFEHPVNCQNQ